MDRHEFGRYLASLRSQLGLSQEEMEQRTGIKKSYINSLEQGVVKQPGPDKINQIVLGYKLKEEEVLAVFYGSREDDAGQEHDLLDAILDQIKKDKNLGLKEFALRAFSEDMGMEAKKFIIKLYEKVTGKKFL
jgi:transcriptional regulator with XRE-family HTH domain